jgi:hypothetical protein
MKTVNSISGGKTSAYIAANYPADYDVFALVRSSDESIKFKDRKLAQEVEDRIQKPFIGTLEDDIIINTIFDLEQFTGRRITWVSGKTFDEVIKEDGRGYLPNITKRFCTQIMKVEPIKHWWQKEINETVEMRIGYRANETNRANIALLKCDKDGIEYDKFITGKSTVYNKWSRLPFRVPKFPLIEDNIYKDNVEKFWSSRPVRFASLNNCVGCFHRSFALLRKMKDWQPDKMKWFAEMEAITGNRWKAEFAYKQVMESTAHLELFPEDFGGNDGCESGYCGI